MNKNIKFSSDVHGQCFIYSNLSTASSLELGTGIWHAWLSWLRFPWIVLPPKLLQQFLHLAHNSLKWLHSTYLFVSLSKKTKRKEVMSVSSIINYSVWFQINSGLVDFSFKMLNKSVSCNNQLTLRTSVKTVDRSLDY